MRIRREMTPEERAVKNALDLSGKGWATKNGPGVRANYVDGWVSLNTRQRAVAIRRGWYRPSWVGEYRANGEKVCRRRRRERNRQDV